MAQKAVEDAVDAYLAANWTACPIYTENQQNETPTDGSPFIIVQFPLSNNERLVVDRRLFIEDSAFLIVINVERGEGTSKIRDFGAQLGALFRYASFGGVTTTNVTDPFTDEQSDQGNYFQGSMTVEYRYTFDG